MADNPLHIVFTGGGTGGHLFPGLAVAEQLVGRVPNGQITFAGSGKEFERRHVVAAGFEYLALPCRPLPRGAREAFRFVAGNLAGYRRARRFVREQHVDGVVGLGGYASVPMAWAASRRGVPLVLLEQNAVPGRATRWLAGKARLVCAAMTQTRSNLRCRCPVHVTGNPIRRGFDEIPRTDPASTLHEPKHQLLVLGGSGGARALNESVPRALSQIRAKLDGWQIVHQSGERGFETTCRLYGKLNVAVTVVRFIDEMPAGLAATDLAVCRAGGTTLAELAAAGVPAVLLPYPHAADDHQRRNADVFTAASGSITLDQRKLPGPLEDHLAAALSGLLGSPERRRRMAAAMRRLARPGAADDVAQRILKVVGGRSQPSGMPAAA